MMFCYLHLSLNEVFFFVFSEICYFRFGKGIGKDEDRSGVLIGNDICLKGLRKIMTILFVRVVCPG
jgi:hypothetical protein